MKGNPVFYKSLVVGVIVLFIGVGIQPSFADTQLEEKDENYINITSEFTGLSRKQTIEMTQQEVEELDAFLDSIYVKLNNSQSDEETSDIIDEVICELEKYGLLCGLSVEQVKKRFSLYNKLNDFYSNYLPATTNTNCLIVGKTTSTYSFSPLYWPIQIFRLILYNIFPIIGVILMFGFGVARNFGFPFFPLQIGSYITMGGYYQKWDYFVYFWSEGWLFTNGTNGYQFWNGRFRGTLLPMYTGQDCYYGGAQGFFGLKIFNPINGTTTLLGYAIKVGIENY